MKRGSFPTQNAISRDNGGGGNRTRATFPTGSTLDGLPLFLTATALTASLIPWPSMWQVMGLGALWFLTLFGGKRT